MKRVIISLLCLHMGMVAARAQQQVPVNQPPAKTDAANPDPGVFSFREETHDFGSVAEGPKAENDFEFLNSGYTAIHISNVKSPCGCTVASWPHDPILPGQTATIHVAFNTEGRPGKIDKTLTITSDARQNPMLIHITGDVQGKTPAPGNQSKTL